MVVKEKLPVVTVASSDFQDVIDAVRLFRVMKKMRQTKILVVADGESWGARGDVVARVEEIFGVQVTQIDSGMLRSYYERSDTIGGRDPAVSTHVSGAEAGYDGSRG